MFALDKPNRTETFSNNQGKIEQIAEVVARKTGIHFNLKYKNKKRSIFCSHKALQKYMNVESECIAALWVICERVFPNNVKTRFSQKHFWNVFFPKKLLANLAISYPPVFLGKVYSGKFVRKKCFWKKLIVPLHPLFFLLSINKSLQMSLILAENHFLWIIFVAWG